MTTSALLACHKKIVSEHCLMRSKLRLVNSILANVMCLWQLKLLQHALNVCTRYTKDQAKAMVYFLGDVKIADFQTPRLPLKD